MDISPISFKARMNLSGEKIFTKEQEKILEKYAKKIGSRKDVININIGKKEFYNNPGVSYPPYSGIHNDINVPIRLVKFDYNIKKNAFSNEYSMSHGLKDTFESLCSIMKELIEKYPSFKTKIIALFESLI